MKKAIFITLLCCTLALCGCAKNSSTTTAADDSNYIYVSDTSVKPLQNKLIERNESPAVEAPDGSISFDEACKLLDTCEITPFYIAQSMKDYGKYYFGTIDYKNGKFYSVYPTLEVDGKKIFLGTNCLIACEGGIVLAQNWMGGYDSVATGTASQDKDWKTRCPDASVSPNDALATLVRAESKLGLEQPITAYTFEIEPTLKDINGIPCYVITPKLEYTDHIDVLGCFYVSGNGKGVILRNTVGEVGEYEEVK